MLLKRCQIDLAGGLATRLYVPYDKGFHFREIPMIMKGGYARRPVFRLICARVLPFQQHSAW